jgi:hypothetical protein
MPRNVRNFWIDLNVDGRNGIGSGPKNKEGGMNATINIRHEGSIYKALKISAWSGDDGRLILEVESPLSKNTPEGMAVQVQDSNISSATLRITAKR